MNAGIRAAFVATALWAARSYPEEPSASNGWSRFVAQAVLTGSVRAGYWSSSRSLDDRRHLGTMALWLKASPKLGSMASVVVEGWLRHQGFSGDGDETAGTLREAYLNLGLGAVDLRVGKQTFVWGRADRINPTDNLTTRAFTLLVPEDNDQREGVLAVKASYYHGGVSLTAVWLPHFEPDTVPIGSLPPPFRLRERAPGKTLWQGAVKIEQTGKAVDWSLSYFNGLDLLPDLGIETMSPSAVDLSLSHHRIEVFGGDAATTAGAYGLRGEVAYTRTADAEGKEPGLKHPFLFAVAGGDRGLPGGLNVALQYSLRVVSRYRNPGDVADPLARAVAIQRAALNNQVARVQHAASLRLGRKWRNETLEAEVAGLISFTTHDYAVRPKLTYAFTDRWKGIFGADLWRGSETTFLGRLRDNSAVYAELRWDF